MGLEYRPVIQLLRPSDIQINNQESIRAYSVLNNEIILTQKKFKLRIQLHSAFQVSLDLLRFALSNIFPMKKAENFEGSKLYLNICYEAYYVE